MNKTKVVVKEARGCRILINPEPAAYAGKAFLINPDLMRVRGIPPEELDIIGGRVVSLKSPPLPPLESVERLEKQFARLVEKVDALPRLSRAHAKKYALPPIKPSNLPLILAVVTLLSVVISGLCQL